MPYVVKDWDKNFENAQSRKAKRLQWVPIPNKHDGTGFRRIAAMRNRSEVFTGWILLLELASKSPTRGVLLDSGGNPLSCTEMALKTGFPEATFEAAIDALKSPEIGWIEETDSMTGSVLPAHSHRAPIAVDHDGAEGNGREKKLVAFESVGGSGGRFRGKINGNEMKILPNHGQERSRSPDVSDRTEDVIGDLEAFTGDKRNRAFFQKAIRALGPHLVEEAMGEVKMRSREGSVNDKARYLTVLLKDWMEGRKR